MTTIAFIGLGNMGGPMAANLVKAGHEVIGFDLVAASRAPRRAACRSPERDGGGGGADVVITMLPAGKHVARSGARSSARRRHGALLIDCSTIDVESARKAHAPARGAGFASIDAPVSGGIGGAKAGDAHLHVRRRGGSLRRRQADAGKDGQAIVHCGGAGTGQAAKICNNMILGVSMIASPRRSCWPRSSAFRIRRCSTSPRPRRANAGR